MPADRCRVCVTLNGSPQYYQRDTEQKREGRWVAIPYFVLDPKQAAPMSEAMAKAFVAKLQDLGVKNLWIEDSRDGRRIEVACESQPQSGEDNRTVMVASLDDCNDYVVRPICRPDGRKWFIRIDIPGIAQPQVIYADDPLAVLQRAADMNFLRYAEKYIQPQPQQTPVTNSNGVRRRPGDLYGK